MTFPQKRTNSYNDGGNDAIRMTKNTRGKRKESFPFFHQQTPYILSLIFPSSYSQLKTLTIYLPSEGKTIMYRSAASLLFLVSGASAFGVSDVQAFATDFSKKAAATALSGLILSNTAIPILPGGEAHADARLVGEIKTSGIVFKDTLNIEQFDDPKVGGGMREIT